MLKIGLFGLTGRMGQAILEAIYRKKHTSLQVVGGTGLQESSLFSLEIDNIAYNFPLLSPQDVAQQADVCIDFSTASLIETHLRACMAHKTPLVIGTTGFSQDVINLFKQAALEIPVLQSGNMSLGVNLLSVLVEKTAHILGLMPPRERL
jgi:4-hydroxy-tetrahydrodipicolinate reductase